MRFVDSNVFVHAFLKPRRRLEAHEAEIREGAKCILVGLEEGEEAATTVIHVSEVANILESRVSREESREMLEAMLSLRSLSVIGVTGETYGMAVWASRLLDVGVNDALAYNAMKERGIDEIYSFDRHFDRLEGVKRLTSGVPRNLVGAGDGV